jgi:hypothetical protein
MVAILPLVIGLIIAAVVVAVGVAVIAASLSNAGRDADDNFCEEPVGSTDTTCPLQVRWVWDAPHTTDRKRYVNLPASFDAAMNGREVELAGHVEPRRSGETVTFNVIANAANDAEAGAATLASATATSGAEGRATVRLTLPVYGGAKFKVGGKTTHQEQPAESGELTVWRKVFYHVTAMEAAPDGTVFTAPADMIPEIVAAFNPVFFELAPGTTSQGTTPYQAHLTAAQRSTLENSLKPTVRDNRSPFKMNIVMVDAADIVGEQEYTGAATAANVATPWFAHWRHESTVIHAKYQTGSTWTDLTNVLVGSQPGVPSNVQVTATIPGYATGTTVNWKIKVRFRRGRAGGWGGTTGTLFMCIGFDRRASASRPTGADLQQALTHETGHALGLVPTTASWRDTDPRDNGYSLRHCGYLDTAAPAQPRCVMWYMLSSAGTGPRNRFCSSDRPNDCAHFLCRTDYSTINWI